MNTENGEAGRLCMYKSRGVRPGAGAPPASMAQRLEDLNNHRRGSRWGELLRRRHLDEHNMSPINSPNRTSKGKRKSVPKQSGLDKRREMLHKWQQEKKKLLQKQKAQAKPIFKVQHVATPSHMDLSEVYTQIKGRPINTSASKKQQMFSLAPSTNYKFKPPATIKPVTSTTAAINSVKVVSKAKPVCNTNKARQARVPILKSNTSTAPKPSTSRLPYNKQGPSTRQLKNVGTKASTSKQNSNSQSVKESTEAAETEDEVSVPLKTKSKRTRKSRRSRSAPNSFRPRECPITKADSTDSDLDQPLTSSNKNSPSTVAYVSPFVTMSRGKENARKEHHRRSVLQSGHQLPESSSTGSNCDQALTPITKNIAAQVTYISPFVTKSRGKDNARKEYHRRSMHTGSEKKSPPLDEHGEVDSTSPKAAATYFTKLLTNQTERLQKLCGKWNLYKEEEDPPEEVCNMINVAIGQTELLLKKKFNQFKGLINGCKSGDGERPVTCLDLHGFWDTVMIQVDNLDQRFDNLERLKHNSWEELLPQAQPKKNERPKRAAAKKQQASCTSGLRAAIQEARRRKAEMKHESVVDHISVPSTSHRTTRSSSRLAALTSVTPATPGAATKKMPKGAKSAEKTNLLTPCEAPRSILKPARTQSVGRTAKSVLFKDGERSPANKENSDISNLMSFSPITTQTPTRRSSRIVKKLI